MIRLTIKVAYAAAACAMLAGGAAAQEEIGELEFQERCAACHGVDGRGGGPVGNLFENPPKDLALISQRNDGVFPFGEVYEAIDGRREVRGHGTSDMPLWGRYFTDQVRLQGLLNPTPLQEQESKIVQGRILSLVYYIQSIQK